MTQSPPGYEETYSTLRSGWCVRTHILSFIQYTHTPCSTQTTSSFPSQTKCQAAAHFPSANKPRVGRKKLALKRLGYQLANWITATSPLDSHTYIVYTPTKRRSSPVPGHILPCSGGGAPTIIHRALRSVEPKPKMLLALAAEQASTA